MLLGEATSGQRQVFPEGGALLASDGDNGVQLPLGWPGAKVFSVPPHSMAVHLAVCPDTALPTSSPCSRGHCTREATQSPLHPYWPRDLLRTLLSHASLLSSELLPGTPLE